MRRRFCFLFNDLLLVAKKKKEGYSYKRLLFTKDIQLQDVAELKGTPSSLRARAIMRVPSLTCACAIVRVRVCGGACVRAVQGRTRRSRSWRRRRRGAR